MRRSISRTVRYWFRRACHVIRSGLHVSDRRQRNQQAPIGAHARKAFVAPPPNARTPRGLISGSSADPIN
jgi:hypothetical protein